MLIKNNNPESLWIHCSRCGASFHPGGSCKCGNIKTETGKSGATMIVAEDSDEVVYDNE